LVSTVAKRPLAQKEGETSTAKSPPASPVATLETLELHSAALSAAAGGAVLLSQRQRAR